MPPRFSYWTILAGGLPTAFRALEREELMPTFQRLREKHPDAEMKWFARGKLWESPEAARQDTENRRGGFSRDARGDARGDARRGGPSAFAKAPADKSGPPSKPDVPPGPADARGRDWRPGGEHRDPRQKYKDAKKAGNLERRKDRFERKHGGGESTRPDHAAGPRGDAKLPPKRAWDRPRGDALREKPHGDTLRPHRDDADSKGPSRLEAGFEAHRPGASDNRRPPSGDRDARPPKRDWREPRDKPHGDPLRPHVPGKRPFDNRTFKPSGDRDTRPPKRDWREPRDKPHGDPLRPHVPGKRPFDNRTFKPSGDRDTRPPKRDWREPRDKPHGDPLRPHVPGKRPFDNRTFKPSGDRDARPPKRDWNRSRDAAPASRKRDWEGSRKGAPQTPKPEWSRPRGDTPREKPHGDRLRPRGDDADSRRPSGLRGGFDARRPTASGDRRPPSGDQGARSGPPNRGWDRSRHDTPRAKPHGDPVAPRVRDDRTSENRSPERERHDRPFERKSFPRRQGTEQRPSPKPHDPDREPRRDASAQAATPRPTEPVTPPPGPPERGRLNKDRSRRDR